MVQPNRVSYKLASSDYTTSVDFTFQFKTDIIIGCRGPTLPLTVLVHKLPPRICVLFLNQGLPLAPRTSLGSFPTLASPFPRFFLFLDFSFACLTFSCRNTNSNGRRSCKCTLSRQAWGSWWRKRSLEPGERDHSGTMCRIHGESQLKPFLMRIQPSPLSAPLRKARRNTAFPVQASVITKVPNSMTMKLQNSVFTARWYYLENTWMKVWWF